MKRNVIFLAVVSIVTLWLSSCIISTSPSTTTPVSIHIGASQTFSVKGSMNGPYEWSKNNVVIPGITEASYTYTALEEDTGIFILKVQTKDKLTGNIISKQWNVNVIDNMPPVAEAGTYAPVTLGSVVNLNGSASYDPEGKPLTYTWSVLTRPAASTASIVNPYTARPTFTPDKVGGYTIQLIVSDGVKTATDTATVSAYILNYPPTADAGPDQTVHIFRTVTFNGSGSTDPENQALSYAWTIESKPSGSAAWIANPTTVSPTFVPDKTGTYVIGLIVSDGELSSGKDTLTVMVTNNAPIANAGLDVTILQGETTRLNGGASSDPDGDALSYSWVRTTAPAGSMAVLSDPYSPAPTFTPDKKGAYVFTLTVSDGDLSANASVIVTSSNNVPVANAGADVTIEFGQSAHLDGSASSDPDGDPLTYAWTIKSGPDTSMGQLSSSSAARPVFTPSRKGIYTLSLVVTDNELLSSAPDDVVVTTTNHAPVAEAGDDINLIFFRTAHLNGSGTDADSDPLTYKWTIISCPGGSSAALSSTTIANPTFTPDVKGTYVIGLTVNDGETDSMQDTMTINVYNNAPTAEAGPDYSFTFGSGETVHLDGSASSDPDEGTTLSYHWTVTSAPYGSTAALLPDANVVNPSIKPDLPGIYVISLVASDGDLYSAPDSLTITAINNAPTAEAGPDQSISFPGITANFNGDASHAPSGLPLSYAWTIVTAPSGSHASLTNPNSVNPSLTPDKEGQYVITLVVFDGYDYSTPDAVTVTVGDAPMAIAGADQELGFPGKTANLDGSASFDPNGSLIVSYFWNVDSAPAGSTALISNPTLMNPTFSPDKVGVYVISLVVSDGAFSSAADTLTITVINHFPIADAGPDMSVIFGYGAAATLNGSASSDPDGSSLTYSWVILTAPPQSVIDLTNPGTVNPSFVPDKKGDYTISLTVNDGYLNSTPDTVKVTAYNDPPTANAGPDQNVSFNQTVHLNGSGSTDPEGHTLTYAWTMISTPSGSSAALAGADTIAPTFVADKSGAYVISLVVSDGVNTSSSDTVTITASNHAPTANAGSDISLVYGYGDVAHLDGSGSSDQDPDTTLTYAWTITSRPAGSTAALSNSTIVNPTFLPDKEGSYTVSLVVSDGELFSSPDTVIINATNQAPHAEAGDNQTAAWNTLVTLNGGGSYDPELHALTYSWAFTSRPTNSNATLTGATTVSPSFTPDKTGVYIITLTVSDGVNTASDSVTVTVPNNTPIADAGTDQNIFFGTGLTATLDGSASHDPENDPLTYHWTIVSAPVGSSASLSDPNAEKPMLTPDMKGTYLISLVVSDGVNVSAADSVTITAYNVAPTVEAGNNQTAQWNTLVTLIGSASDPESQPMTYSWVFTSRPTGSNATLSNAASLTPSFTPDKTGDYVVTLTVSDGVNSVTDNVTVTVPNEAPTAEAGPDQNLFFDGLGATATLDGSGSHDPENDNLTYSWTIVSSPSGSSAIIANPTSVTPTLTPDKVGDYLISLVVSDGLHLSTADYVTITAYNVAPTVNAGNDQTVYKDQTTTLTGSATDPENQTLTPTWTVTVRPSGSTAQPVSPNSFSTSFTPDRKGSFTLQLSVTDGVNTVTDTMIITVPNRAPTAEAGPDVNPLYKGQATTLAGSGSDADGDTLTYAWSVSSGPNTSASQFSNPSIAGPTFTPNSKGVYVLQLTVGDGTANATDTLTVTVPNRAPTAEAGPDVNPLYKGQATTLAGSGSDADGDTLTYSWSVSSGPNTSASQFSNPSIAGPTFTPNSKGVYVLQLAVSDGTANATDTLTVTVPNRAPTAEAGNDQSTYKGQATTLAGSGSDADGDTLTYTWSVSSGPNLSSAQFSNPNIPGPTFTPTSKGTYVLQLNVSDGTASGTDTMTLSVPNRAPTANAGADQTAVKYANRTVQISGSGSSDLDGDTLTYSWSVTSRPTGSSATLSSTTIVNPTITLDLPGSYTIQLIVDDGTVSSAADTIILTTSQATYTTSWEAPSNLDSGGNAWTLYTSSNMGTCAVDTAQKRSGSYGYHIEDCNNTLGNCGSGYSSMTNYTGKFVISVSAWFYTPTSQKFPADLAGIFEGTTERVHYPGKNSWTQYTWAPNRVVTNINLRMNGTGGATWISHAMYSDDISVTIWD
ncbi:MAG TPA: PKD domain-containing protein [Desulfomonilia bacterium]